MPYPFTTNLNTGYREYYGPSLEDPREAVTPMYTTRTQEPFYQSSIVPFSVGVGTLFASGFIPIGRGRRLWDPYVSAIRAVEEYSPASILRTFQLSPIFSQFTTPSLMELSAQTLRENRAYTNYLTTLIGGSDRASTYAKLVGEGVRFDKGQLFFGGGDLALKRASVINAPVNAGLQFGLGYAASTGQTLYKSDIPVEDDLIKLIIGGQNRFQSFGRQATGLGTTYVGRFNELLRQPFELEPFRTVFGKVEPLLKKISPYGFAVKPGTGLEMMGRFAFKYGLGLGAAYMGYQTVDYMLRQSEMLDDTLLEEGLTAGIATLGIRANLALSKAAEMTGLHTYREAQEDIAPGSTSLQKLLALPLVGGFGALTAGYAAKVYSMAQAQIKDPKLTSAGARKLIEEAAENFGGDDWYSHIGKSFTTETGNLYNRQDMIGTIMRKIATPEEGALRFKLVGKIGPVKLIGLAGMAAGAALALPFLPGALIPSTRPEELERIYSGEQEVAIRKGRFWEFGRSPYEGGRIMYYRPHWYPRMLMRAKEKAIYGEEELSPIEKFYKRELTYQLEQEHYQDRPYPLCLHPDTPILTKNGYCKIQDIKIGDMVLNKNGKWTKVTHKTNRYCYEKKLINIHIASDNRIIQTTPEHKILVLKNNNNTNKRGNRNRNKKQTIFNNSLEWIEAKDIKRHDFVVIPVPEVESNNTNFFDLAIITNRVYTDDTIVLNKNANQSLQDALNSKLSIKEAYKKYNVSYKILYQLRSRGGYSKHFPRFMEIDEDLLYLFGLYIAEGWISKNSDRKSVV